MSSIVRTEDLQHAIDEWNGIDVQVEALREEMKRLRKILRKNEKVFRACLEADASIDSIQLHNGKQYTVEHKETVSFTKKKVQEFMSDGDFGRYMSKNASTTNRFGVQSAATSDGPTSSTSRKRRRDEDETVPESPQTPFTPMTPHD